MCSRYRHRPERKLNIGICSPGGWSGNGRRIPFGRPVVPEEYSIAVPRRSSSSGVEGAADTVVSKSTKRSSVMCSGTPPHTTMRRMLSNSATASSTMGNRSVDVINTSDRELLTMYAISLAVRYELMQV